MTFLQQTIRYFLALIFLLESQPFMLAADANARQVENDKAIRTSYEKVFAGDPIWDEFVKAPFNPPKMGPFDPKDPVLDVDPYFMRSQNWSQVAAFSGDGFTAHTQNGGVLIQAPGQSRALFVKQDLRPAFETEDFAFFQTSKKTFEDKAADKEAYGEGLFFIDKRDFKSEAQMSHRDPRPIPVFFFPLNGQGWTEKLHATSVLTPGEIIALRNATGNSITIELEDIYELAKLLHNNVGYSIIFTLKTSGAQLTAEHFNNWKKNANGPLELPMAYPARGSTAAFGTFFTGLDLDNPSKSLFDIAQNNWFTRELFPTAHASDLLSPDVLGRLLVIAGITGTTLIASIFAKYTILKEPMLDRREYIEAKQDDARRRNDLPPIDRSGVGYKVKREIKEWVDVFSHGLATVSAGFGTTAGFLIEYGADRILGKQATAQNGLVRRFLNYTFLYGRKQNEFIAANWNSFILGVMVLGGIDTAFVALQLLFVSPYFFPWVASGMGDDIHSRVVEQFSGKDSENNNVITSEILRNLGSYFVSGAYSYSSSQRQALLEIVRPNIEKEMRGEGKDPQVAENHDELMRRIEVRIDNMLVERGLPSRKEFLFSGPSVFRSLMGLMGYKIDKKALAKKEMIKKGMNPEDPAMKKELKRRAEAQTNINVRIEIVKEELQKEGWDLNTKDKEQQKKIGQEIAKRAAAETNSYLLEQSRQGILSQILKNALLAAKQMAADNPGDPVCSSAVAMLEEVRNDYHILSRIIANPLKAKEAIQKGIKVRKMLTLLSYDGTLLTTAVKHVDAWDPENRDPAGATVAARLFRQSLYSIVQDKDYLLMPSEAQVEKHREAAEQMADQQIAEAKAKGLGDEEPMEKSILTLEATKKLIAAEDGEKATAAWKPAKQGLVERLQARLADKRAKARVQEKLIFAGVPNGESSEDYTFEQRQADYREFYAEELGKIVGLSTLPKEQSDVVRSAMKDAEEQVQKNLEENPGFKRYYDSLSQMEQLQFLAHQYADTYLARYVEKTVSNSDYVSLTSPEQPGVFQKLRQTSFVEGDGLLAKTVRLTLRGVESMMDNSAYRPGLVNWARRNIPWFQDVKSDISLSWRAQWTALTVGYLVQFHLWQVKMDWSTYMFFFWTSGIVGVLHWWLDRLMINMGIRPMHDLTSKLKYSVVYSWLTYPAYIPFFFFYPGFDKAVAEYVYEPAKNHVIAPSVSAVQTVVSSCERLLQGLF